MLYTVMPWDAIFPGDTESRLSTVLVNGRLCVIRRDHDGWARIERLLSTDPQDYLQDALDPAQPVKYLL